MIEPYKFLIQPVAIERDDETGRVTREMPGEVLAVFSAEQAAEMVTMFEQALAAQQNGGTMPVENVSSVNITCDNPDCPGNDLDSSSRDGWFFVSREVYGLPSEQFVYCCAECSGTLQAVPVPPPLGPPVDAGEPIPG